MSQEIDDSIEAIRSTGLWVTDEGYLNNFLGVNIKKNLNGTIEMSQPNLINQILADLGYNIPNIKTKDTP